MENAARLEVKLRKNSLTSNAKIYREEVHLLWKITVLGPLDAMSKNDFSNDIGMLFKMSIVLPCLVWIYRLLTNLPPPVSEYLEELPYMSTYKHTHHRLSRGSMRKEAKVL
jgi:hypothetical protein